VKKCENRVRAGKAAPNCRPLQINHFSKSIYFKCIRVCWDSSGVYHGCGEMDHGGEALIGLVGAHCDAFELLEPAKDPRCGSRDVNVIFEPPPTACRGSVIANLEQ
jgi:hypothetical protein